MAEHDARNPYASPSEDAQRQNSAKFTLDEEQRKIISSTATLMIVAGILQILVTLLDALRSGGSKVEVMLEIGMFGVVPAFLVIAGFSLRSAAAQGSVESLLSGFRQLYVAFLVKGLAMLLVLGLGLLTILMMVLGIGAAFSDYFGR
jgi:hypothetical protein